MRTFGYVLFFLGILFVRGAIRDRTIQETSDDIAALMLSIVRLDWPAIDKVLATRGEGTNFVFGEDVPAANGDNNAGSDTQSGSTTGARVLAEAVRLGTGKKYRLGATGPDAYDCSGLVWRAMRNVGAYSGPRFTTATWPVVAVTVKAKKVDTPAVGDIALWPGHMGIVDGTGTTFAARSPQYGIGTSKIDVTSKSVGGRPVFYRLK